MSLIETMKTRRSAIKAELEALLETAESEVRGLNDDESSSFDAKALEMRALDGRIDELIEGEKREAAAADHVVETRKVVPAAVATGEGVTSEPNPEYRRNDPTSRSYFGDLFQAKVNADPEARRALMHSQETRTGDLNTGAGTGGQFAPPEWLVSDFVALARPGRVTADLMNKQTLPSGVSSINLPKVNSGVTAAVQATQNTAVSDTALTTTSVTSGITTIAGKQTVSMQLLAQSGIPFDQVILGDLALAYASQLDTQVLSGSGVSGQLRGLASGSGVGATAFTTTAPAVTSATSANSFYNSLIHAANDIYANRFLPPTAILMHPQRWSWVLEGLDSQGRPLIIPNGAFFNAVGTSSGPTAEGQAGELLGLPVYLDPNIPVTVGAGTNQDVVYVLRASDCWLYESAIQSASFDATYADQATVLFRILGYAAFIPDRYGKSVNAINGTGLVTPTL